MELDSHRGDATGDVITLGSATGDSPLHSAPDEGLVDELLIEEISIDGMCGVY